MNYYLSNKTDNHDKSQDPLNEILDENKSIIKMSNNVYKGINDKHEYKYVKLDNGLQIFFIQNDKNTNMSTAHMYVNVGTLDNPIELEGMAHFLEHMLFMGSKEYPGGSYFQNQVSMNGGHTNAFTADNSTQYYFTTKNNFYQLLHIFSRFFVTPIFDETYLTKELNSVESEHNKNISSDGWRIMNISKNLFKNVSLRKFGTGTSKTLLEPFNNNHKLLRDAVIKFYNDHYSSDKMVLYICHNSIDDNTITQISNMFNDVSINSNVKNNKLDAEYSYKDKHYELIKVKTLSKENHLSIKWIIDQNKKHHNNVGSANINILTHLLGCEVDYSLHYILTSLNLVMDIYVGIEHDFDSNSILSIDIKLTDKGYDIWEFVIYFVCKYITIMSAQFKQNKTIYSDLHNNLDKLSKLYFLSQDKKDGSSLTQYFSEVYDIKKIDLKYLPIQQLLYSNHHESYKGLLHLLDQLTLGRMKVILSSDKLDDKDFNKYDKYYFVKYDQKFVPFDNDNMKIINNIEDIDTMPIPKIEPIVNPDNIQIINTISDNDKDYCKIHSKKGNLYFVKKQNQYDTVNICMFITIELSSLKNYNVDNYIKLILFIGYIDKLINTKTYQLRLSNISLDVSVNNNELTITIEGVSGTNIRKITEEILDYYFGNKSDIEFNTFNKTIYESVHESLMKRLKSYSLAEPYSIAISEFTNMTNPKYSYLVKNMITSLEKQSIDKLSQKDQENYYKNTSDLLKEGLIIGIFGGSIRLNEVNRIIDYFDNNIINNTHTDVINRVKNNLDNKTLSKNMTIESENKDNKDNAICYGIYLDNIIEKEDSDFLKKIYINIVDQIISDKFTALIRTEKQVGYVVTSSSKNINNSVNGYIYLIFIIQSERNDLVGIVEDYINNNLIKDLENVTDDEYKHIINTMISDMNEEPYNIVEDIIQYSSFIFGSPTLPPQTPISTIDERKEKIISLLKNNVTKKDIIKYIKDKIDNDINAYTMININKKNNTKNNTKN